MDGININFIGGPLTDAKVYTSNAPATFADDTTSNYDDEDIDLPLATGYQRDLHDGTLLPSSSVGGSSSTYITDYYWASAAAGWRVLGSGGGLSAGADAGTAARDAGIASSIRSASIAGRSAA